MMEIQIETARDVLQRLDRALADAPHEDDAGAPNEQQRLGQRRQQLRNAVMMFKLAIPTREETESAIPPLEKWLDDLNTMRETLCDELKACPPQSPKMLGLKLSITMIDRGLNFRSELHPDKLPIDDLLKAAGYDMGGTLALTCAARWPGSLMDTERKLKALRKRHDDAARELRNALTFAESLLGASVTD